MKIIVSHDVDHLYAKDHWFRDLYFQKLWYRETRNLIAGNSSIDQWTKRCSSCFAWSINNIKSLVEYDKSYGVPSFFFFGMQQGLNMSYRPKEAKSIIEYVESQGLMTGVHGIAYDNEEEIQTERNCFIKTIGKEPAGIRMHYVRSSSSTLNYLERAGYIFDSSLFDRELGYTIEPPFKNGNIWEFPVCLMDSFIEGNLEEKKIKTKEIVDLANREEIEYFTLLFHDVYYSKTYLDYMRWYEWVINMFDENDGFTFISFLDAVKELSDQRENNE